MLNFLFGDRTAATRPEKLRVRFDRLVSELNAMIDDLPAKPRVTIDPETGHILPEAPDQFADETLALPRPDADQGVERSDAVMPKAAGPKPPRPNPPKPRAPGI